MIPALQAVDLREILRELYKNIWLLVLGTVGTWFMITGVGTLMYTPEYTSQATVAISVQGYSNNYSELSVANQMAEVYCNEFQSATLKRIIGKVMVDDIDGTITCEQIGKTNLLILTVKSSGSRQAYLYLKTAIENYEVIAGEVFANARLEVVQEPSVSTRPTNMSFLMKNRWTLSFVSLIGMCMVVIGMYLLRHTVKSERLAEQVLDGKVRGTISFVNKKDNKTILLNTPAVSAKFAEQNRSIAIRVIQHMRKKHFHTAVITSVNENEGKSTCAVNLAIAIAETGKKVLLIDGDLLRPAVYKIFDYQDKEGKSLSEVLVGKYTLKEAVTYHEKLGIWELLQWHSVGDDGGILNVEQLKELIDELKKEMDYILIDSSPMRISSGAERWVQVADTVLFVVRQDWSDTREINDTVDLICRSDTDFGGYILNAFRQSDINHSKYGNYDYGYRKSRKQGEQELDE